jgi:phosphoserine phosphatase RsbU/P
MQATAKPAAAMPSRVPLPSATPALAGTDSAAVYRHARLGGDFYEFLLVGHRLLLLLLDVAGHRDRAMEIAAVVQDAIHREAPRLFAAHDVNESEALAELALLMNRTVLAAADGVCLCAAFLACYNREIGTLAHVNAGHPPGLVRDPSGVAPLPASGLPLGLFTHAPYEAQMRALVAGSALLLVSRGVIEAGPKKRQFGMEGVERAFLAMPLGTAQELCDGILAAAEKFIARPLEHNDVTAVALVRLH